VRTRSRFTTVLVTIMVAAAGLLAGCLGRQSSIVLDAEEARWLGVVAVQLEVGDGEVVDFCVVLSDSLCGFSGGEAVTCGLDVASGGVQVFCADPLLIQLPSAWTVTEAAWRAPSIPDSGAILVEPAYEFLTAPGTQIITDPGFSAYVMRLDATADFGPVDVELSLAFDHGDALAGCIKGVEVMVGQMQGSFPLKILVPLGDPVIDFTTMASPDSTICLDELVDAQRAPLPERIALQPPMPNPARGSVRLVVELPEEAEVALAIHDVQGRRVRRLADRQYAAGRWTFIWDGRDETGRAARSGVYYARLAVDGRPAAAERVILTHE